MSLLNLNTELENNTYPGRGIVIGKSADGKKAVFAYFIMGRSENSRNRIFEETPDGIRTRAFDESKLGDPSLVIYAPVRTLGQVTIVTNGDQTDTLRDFIAAGKSPEEALRTRTFEPDPPLFTPRISGVASFSEGGFSYQLSILKSDNGNGDAPLRFFFDYPVPLDGQGHFIHTYQSDGNPPLSFAGEPKTVEISGDLDTFTQTIWEALNPDNKISLFTRFVDLASGDTETRILNKYTR